MSDRFSRDLTIRQLRSLAAVQTAGSITAEIDGKPIDLVGRFPAESDRP